MTIAPYKIIKLTTENVLRLNAVEITPEGNLIVIGGENEQGKTSVLDSIVLAMGGRVAKHTMPLKAGTKKGKIVVELPDLKITRTFTATGGGTIKVESKEGAVYPSPQAMLDKLVGHLTFDPLAWAKMDDKKQLDILKAMVGLDFSVLDEQRKTLYATRTSINQEVKRLTGSVETMPHHADAPEVEVSVAALILELSERQKINTGNQKVRDALSGFNQAVVDANQDAVLQKVEIDNLEKRLVIARKDLVAAEKNLETIIENRAAHQTKIDALQDANEQEIKDQIASAEGINAKLRANKNRAEKEAELTDAETRSKNLTAKIEIIDTEKEARLAAAKFPVEGLSFDETGVTYKGIPFDQASSAEKLRVSIAMGIAMNPKLKVLLIRDGSLLDEKNLKLVAQMADESGHQIWLERVGKGKECSVIIKDGYLEEARTINEEESAEDEIMRLKAELRDAND